MKRSSVCLQCEIVGVNFGLRVFEHRLGSLCEALPPPVPHMHDHGVQLVDGVQFFPGSICVSGFATPVVNCGTARVPMGLPM